MGGGVYLSPFPRLQMYILERTGVAFLGRSLHVYNNNTRCIKGSPGLSAPFGGS